MNYKQNATINRCWQRYYPRKSLPHDFVVLVEKILIATDCALRVHEIERGKLNKMRYVDYETEFQSIEIAEDELYDLEFVLSYISDYPNADSILPGIEDEAEGMISQVHESYKKWDVMKKFLSESYDLIYVVHEDYAMLSDEEVPVLQT